jgi:hypothetical protein
MERAIHNFAVLSDFGIKKRLSKRFQLRQRAFFVDPY